MPGSGLCKLCGPVQGAQPMDGILFLPVLQSSFQVPVLTCNLFHTGSHLPWNVRFTFSSPGLGHLSLALNLLRAETLSYLFSF